MPRGARLDAPGTLHHVIIRGIERGSIVIDDSDRIWFFERMGLLAKETGTSIYAFALMTNHAHLLIKSGPTGISAFMRKLLTGYAQYFNRRHKRIGHLFQNRYKSIICQEEAYFDKLIAYIHLNPLRAGIVHNFEELSVYKWSGHAVLMGTIRYDWMDSDYVLQFFGSREGQAKQAYAEFLEFEAGIDREQELTGGGLVRSHGGWSQVQSMRKKGAKSMSDERILGDDAFVREVLSEAEERVGLQLTADERSCLLNEAIRKACGEAGVSEAFLRSGSRSGMMSSIRKKLALQFVNEYGLSLAETARKLGVATNTVSYMLRKR
ncbi:MAG: hypothetical protein HGB36_12870 [Chlorobiaceae bacterium]|nr:hypothetical protein [Chlorobiaceae bacterium]